MHRQMKKTTSTMLSLLLAMPALLAGCSEDAGVPSAPPGTPSGLLLRGTMPGGGDATRAYVDGKGGFFWNAADTVMVTDSYYSSYGAMFTGSFSASPGSDGQKTATFQVDLADTPAGDINQYLVPWLLQGATDYYAIFPKTLGMGDDPALGATYNYSFPATQVQSGASSRHLAKYMLMTSGKVDIDRSGSGGSLAQEGSLVRLPDFSLTHRTSLMRLRVLNRQANPIDVRRVSVSARRADGSTAYFKAGCSYYVLADSVMERGGAYATLAVELRGDDGSPGCAVAGGGELSAYAAMLPNATGGVEFTFEVETADAVYKTLAFPGDRIQGARFEAGKYYTFELLVDHGLSVQAWEADRLDDIIFGQDAFSVSADRLTLPLAGGTATLRVAATSSGGWTLEECPEWLTPGITSAPQGTTNLRLTAQPATAGRSGTLCFASGNLRKWITVTQADVETTADDAIYVTAAEMNGAATKRILQDDEPASVYCDPEQRAFNTAMPLQATVEGGRLHLRFYSPRKLDDVEIWATMPSVTGEEFLLARLEEVAPFADFYRELPFLTRDCTFTTASGKRVTVRKNPYFPDAMLTLRPTSYCDYWRKLERIKHGWNISFSLYGGDPTKPDGGPTPNWVGIRPVHCREAVALFLNVCFITDMKEHEEMIRANEHLLYGNGGKGDPVTAERVMAQMREPRSIKVGLVSPTHAAGLGGYGVFGLDEWRYLNYHDDWGACTVVFHELGHVLGYNHSSSFTSGPWTQQLMSNFYLDHREKLPVESTKYLDSKNNPNLYYN